MTETPTPDEIARWAAEHRCEPANKWLPDWCAACETAWPCPTTRLLALVAAQAEQNAKWEIVERHWADVHIRVAKAEAEVANLRAELSALRATDEYQRWARAVVERDAALARVETLIARLQRAVERLNECEFRKRRAEVERDAAREAIAAMRGAVDAVLAQALIRRSLPDTRRAIDNVRDEIRAALEGGAAT